MAAGHTKAEDQRLLEEAFPDICPDWDPKSGANQAHSDTYHRHLLVQLNGATKKTIKLSKTTGVLESPTEASSFFLEKLQDVFKTCTRFDPEAPENIWTINLTFDSQSAPLRRNKSVNLGMAGYCRLWIASFTEVTRPLFETTAGSGPLKWTKEEQQAFEAIEASLVKAPPLALPNVTKPFNLSVAESQRVANGFLTWDLGP